MVNDTSEEPPFPEYVRVPSPPVTPSPEVNLVEAAPAAENLPVVKVQNNV